MEVSVLHPTASPDLENQWLQPVSEGYEVHDGLVDKGDTLETLRSSVPDCLTCFAGVHALRSLIVFLFLRCC